MANEKKIDSYEVKNCANYYENPMWKKDWNASDVNGLKIEYCGECLLLSDNNTVLGEIIAPKKDKMFLSKGQFVFKLEDRGTQAGMDNRLVLHVFTN